VQPPSLCLLSPLWRSTEITLHPFISSYENATPRNQLPATRLVAEIFWSPFPLCKHPPLAMIPLPSFFGVPGSAKVIPIQLLPPLILPPPHVFLPLYVFRDHKLFFPALFKDDWLPLPPRSPCLFFWQWRPLFFFGSPRG